MNILLVEDDDLDAMMLERAVRKFDSDISLVRARDGVEAFDLLSKSVDDADVLPHPNVVLLDINMPRMNGHELLSKLRDNINLKNARVFMFTTSDSQTDVKLAYQANVSGYIVKPDTAERFKEVLSLLKKFWDICEHPPKDLEPTPLLH